MSAFTCLSCHVAFHDADGQRDHFRSDWHRYNLKRKVAELPPVSRDTYNDRALQVENQMAQMAQSKEEKKKYCKPCGRSFANQMSFTNHLSSKKHVEKDASFAQEALNRKNLAAQKSQEMMDTNEENEDKRGNLSCKTCSQSFATDVAYYNHMKSRQHMEKTAMTSGPVKTKQSNKNEAHSSKHVEENSDDDSEYEEVEWEGDAVDLKDCLFCKYHSATLKKKLEHMSVEHSFFIPDLEYCSDVPGLITYLGEKIGCGYECIACKWVGNRCPTLDAVQKHMKDKSHCFLNIEGDKVLEYEEFYDYSSTYPDAGEGTNPGDEVVLSILSGSDYELRLPSGAVVGHRTLMRYYRQKLNPDRTIAIKKTPGRSYTSLLSQYRALGWNNATQADVVRKSKDIKFMQRVKSHQHMRLGVKANKLQHHFRLQNPV